jgi:hypothetical protein
MSGWIFWPLMIGATSFLLACIALMLTVWLSA